MPKRLRVRIGQAIGLTALLLVAGIPQAQSAEGYGTTVVVPALGLALSIPANWKQVPAETLEAVGRDARERFPNSTAKQPDAVFQRIPLTPGKLTYPYIQVSAKPSRPLTRDDLRGVATRSSSQSIAARVRKSTDGYARPETPSLEFDEQDFRIKGTAMSEVAEDMHVSAYLEIIPSTGGAVSLSGFMIGDSAEAARALFRPIFASAVLDASHRYTPN